MKSKLRVAYFVNQYPKVSHAFIRREILALEQQGVDVLRIALRGWSDELVDAADLTERMPFPRGKPCTGCHRKGTGCANRSGPGYGGW